MVSVARLSFLPESQLSQKTSQNLILRLVATKKTIRETDRVVWKDIRGWAVDEIGMMPVDEDFQKIFMMRCLVAMRRLQIFRTWVMIHENHCIYTTSPGGVMRLVVIEIASNSEFRSS